MKILSKWLGTFNAPNSYQARAVNSKKHFVTEIFSFPLSRPSERELRLSFPFSRSDSLGPCLGLKGVRLNTYSDSIGPVWSTFPSALNPTGPSSAAIQRRGAVQKPTTVNPGAIHSK